MTPLDLQSTMNMHNAWGATQAYAHLSNSSLMYHLLITCWSPGKDGSMQILTPHFMPARREYLLT